MHFNYTTWKQRTGGKWPRAVCRAGGKENWGWNSETAQHLGGNRAVGVDESRRRCCRETRQQLLQLWVSVDGGQVASSEVMGTLCKRNLVERQGPAFREVGMRWKRRRSACPVHLLSCRLEQGSHPPAETGRRGATIFSDGYISEECPPRPRPPAQVLERDLLANTVRKPERDKRGRE